MEDYMNMIFPSQQRKESMALAFAELDKVTNPVICEVGRLRSEYAGESDGHSTLAFLDYVNTRGGKLYSIDSDSSTEETCQTLFAEKKMETGRLTYIDMDVVTEFYDTVFSFGKPGIELLYLDAWDLFVTNSAEQHLLCFLLMNPHIFKGGLVLIDDTGYPNLGKGEFIIPVAKLMGWVVLHQGFQTLLRKPV